MTKSKRQPEPGFGGKTFGKHWKDEPLKKRLAHDFDAQGLKRSTKHPFLSTIVGLQSTGIVPHKAVPKRYRLKKPTLHQRTVNAATRQYVEAGVQELRARKKKRR